MIHGMSGHHNGVFPMTQFQTCTLPHLPHAEPRSSGSLRNSGTDVRTLHFATAEPAMYIPPLRPARGAYAVN